MHRREFSGEFIGTFILVFFGCGSVAFATLFGLAGGLLSVAFIWVIGVSLAIYASRKLSQAHLNPAVSFAMLVSGKLSWKQVPVYLSGQFTGAFASAAFLYVLYQPFIDSFEKGNGIIRGTENSLVTASMFGEFFPNPGFVDVLPEISTPIAMLAEAVGTFLLVGIIFWLIGKEHLSKLTPLFIGITVGILICLLAPLSQAGFNPARDFSPRLFSYFAGWNEIAFPNPSFSFFTVYILSPILGALLAAFTFRKQIK